MSDNDDNNNNKVPVFDGKSSRNYRQRCLELLKSYIEEKGWGEALEKTEASFNSSQTDEKEAFLKKDRRTKGFLLRHTDKAPYQVIKNLKTAKEMWERLERRYMPGNARKGIASDIQAEFNRNTTMRGTYNDPTGWMEKIHNLATELENIDARFKKDDLEIMTTILNGLREQYATGVFNWNKEVYDGNLELEALKDEIFLFWEMNLAHKRKETKPGYALTANGKQVPKCSHCGKLGHTKEKCWKLKTCNICGKKGHIAKYCRKAKDNEGETNNTEKEEKEESEEKNNDFVGCTTTEEYVCSVTTTTTDQHLYLLDSGANVHITPYETDLQNITATKHTITVGGNKRLTAVAKGDLHLQTREGRTIVLKNVLLVPGFGKNIININALTNNGTTFIINARGGHLTNRNGTTIQTIKQHGLHFIAATRKTTPSVVYLTDMTGPPDGEEPTFASDDTSFDRNENYEKNRDTTDHDQGTFDDEQTDLTTAIQKLKQDSPSLKTMTKDITQSRETNINDKIHQSRETKNSQYPTKHQQKLQHKKHHYYTL